jgi:putative transposase
MRIGHSTFYDTPDAHARDLTIVAEMKTICDEFEAYGYRRVDAELRHRGIVVNAKKIRRLMREHALNPRQRRRFIAITIIRSSPISRRTCNWMVRTSCG